MMQPLTGGPRSGMAAADVDALLHADDTKVTDSGADLLDLDDRVVADVSCDVKAGFVVSWDGSVDVHRQVTMTVGRTFAWDRDRLRLWCELTSPVLGLTARFYLGVFVLIWPQANLDGTRLLDLLTGEPLLDPVTGGPLIEHEVTGLDKLHLLLSIMPDTWTAATDGTQARTLPDGTTLVSASVADELRRLLAAADYRGSLALALELETATLTTPMVWSPDGTTSWLKVANDFLAAAGADSLWVDEVGTTQTRMIVQVTDRPVEYVLDLDDKARTITSPKRSRTADLSKVPNAWRFSAQDWPTATSEGDGQYTPTANTGDGPTSYAARGRWVWSLPQVTATDQASLVAQATAQVAADKRVAGVRDHTIGVLPILGHDDLIQVVDADQGDPVRTLVTKWELHTDGTDGALTCEEVT